jgi:hydroxymethylbilane synthase
MSNSIRIVSRKSPLALWQAEFVKTQLQTFFPNLNFTVIGITTEGDKILNTPLHKVGGKGLFVKELEEALLHHQADIAVHSMKDVPANLPSGLTIAAILERADPRDAFISNHFRHVLELPPNAIIGTSSLRRQSQLAAIRPDLRFEYLRGNIGTRLHKLDNKAFDAIILAVAGLERLSLQHRITEYFQPSFMLPGIGQGALGIECRTDDAHTQTIAETLHHAPTGFCLEAERQMNALLGGSCQLPVAGLALYEDSPDTASQLKLQGMVCSRDGRRILKTTVYGDQEEARMIGEQAAEHLLNLGAKDIIDGCSDY